MYTNMEYISCHWYERTNVSANYKSEEYLRDHRCEGTNIAYKCILFVAVTNTSWTSVFCIHTHDFIISKVIGINKGKEMCLPNKEYISCYWCKRTNMAAKCKIFINCSRNSIAVNQIWLPNKEHLRDDRCEGTTMA